MGHSTMLDKYTPLLAYISTIIEERQLNVAQMDVFLRLMMDRITLWDCPSTSTLPMQAQLLYLDSVDPSKDISIYLIPLRFGLRDWAYTIQCSIL